MDDVNQRIGSHIQLERERRRWSLTDLAERSGVSRAMVHKVESGASSPTANLLGRLAGAFGLSMSQLIARAEAPEGRLLRQADQPVWVDPVSGYVRRHVSPRTDLPLDLVRIDLPPGTQIAMPAAAYVPLRQLIWVLAGTLTFAEGDTIHNLAEGDCLQLGPPSDCVFSNSTAAVCTYAVVVIRQNV